MQPLVRPVDRAAVARADAAAVEDVLHLARVRVGVGVWGRIGVGVRVKVRVGVRVSLTLTRP